MLGYAHAQTLNFSFDRSKPIEITASELVVSDNEKQAEFIGEVIVIQDKYKLRADRIIVRYMDDKKQSNMIKTIAAFGNVYLYTDQKQAAKAQKMVYNLHSKFLTLSKNVMISYEDNILKGEEISVNTQTRNIKVIGNNKERVKALLILPKN